jgi:hypothetical protein
MTNHWKTLVGLGFVLVGALAMASVAQPAGAWSHYKQAPTPTPIYPTPSQTPIAVELRVIELERRVDLLESLLEVQSNVYNATVQRMESNLNLLLAILAIASLLAAILSLGFARVWIKSLVEERLRGTTSQEVSRLVQKEVDSLREEWEPKFTELYDEYSRLVKER